MRIKLSQFHKFPTNPQLTAFEKRLEKAIENCEELINTLTKNEQEVEN